MKNNVNSQKKPSYRQYVTKYSNTNKLKRGCGKTSPYVHLLLGGKPQASCTPYSMVPQARPTNEIDEYIERKRND